MVLDFWPSIGRYGAVSTITDLYREVPVDFDNHQPVLGDNGRNQSLPIYIDFQTINLNIESILKGF